MVGKGKLDKENGFLCWSEKGGTAKDEKPQNQRMGTYRKNQAYAYGEKIGSGHLDMCYHIAYSCYELGPI